MLRRIFLTLCLAALAACTLPESEDRPVEPLGDFRLGYNIVVAKNAKPIPPSRQATAEEWEAVLKEEIANRFGGYEGDKLYHIGVNVDGYALAIPGVPVVASPKSVLVVSANVYDDAAGEKLHEEPKQLTVFENLSGKSLIGSGLTTSREEQMRNLARNAVRAIEGWLVENRAAWFGEMAGQETPDEAEVVN